MYIYIYLCNKNMDKPLFKLVALQEALDFIESLPVPAADKVYYNIRKVRAGVKDKELFKKLDNTDIWEFRTLYNGVCYRLFAFWDRDAETLVVATHGIIKKTQKTPQNDIEKAERIRKEYFNKKKL